ncbi:MAG: hypothetical protein KDA80_05390, partial [Planctomycetaceae bacterium]|nr:hypothetical protein [Planctomycetaceae bacterium]
MKDKTDGTGPFNADFRRSKADDNFWSTSSKDAANTPHVSAPLSIYRRTFEGFLVVPSPPKSGEKVADRP